MTVYKSLDGGLSWTSSNSHCHDVLDIQVSPSYAADAGADNTVVLLCQGQVRMSRDGGLSWPFSAGFGGGEEQAVSFALAPDFHGFKTGIILVGTTTITNTSIANGSGSSNCTGVITSGGHNLSSDSTCFSTGGTDLLNTNPMLGPLQDNGGPTWTHALLAGSPAIDAVPAAGCTDAAGNPLTTDQRGTARPQGTACDIGAYEFQPAVPTRLAITAHSPDVPAAGQPFSVTVQTQDSNGAPANVSLSTGFSLAVKDGFGTGTLGGTTSGTIPQGESTVTLQGVTYSKAETGVVLTATKTSGDALAAGDSSPSMLCLSWARPSPSCPWTAPPRPTSAPFPSVSTCPPARPSTRSRSCR